MPISRSDDNQKIVVQCVNQKRHLDDKEFKSQHLLARTSMIPMHDWNAITHVKPPNVETNQNLVFVPTMGLPVKVFICTICGYVELYAGPVIEPKTWGMP